MAPGLTRAEESRLLRWIEDSPTVFASLRRILDEYGHFTAAARVTQADRSRSAWATRAVSEA